MAQQTLNSSRRLSILRHAKAGQGDGDDAVRALNERGRRDAQAIGMFLKKQGALPDFVICSTATRTRETLAGLKLSVPTQLSKKAYLATHGELLRLIHEADDAVRHLLLIGHNPGLHQLIVTLAGDYADAEQEHLIAIKFPTCAYASLTFPVKRWKDVTTASGTLDMLAVGKEL